VSALDVLRDQWMLLTLGLLILVLLAVLALVLRAATRPDGDAATPRALPRLASDSLRSSFRQAVELIEAQLASRGQRYSLPWVLLLDEGDGRQASLPLGQAGIPSALGSDAGGRAAVPGLNWHFFDKGVVIDVQSAYLGGGDEASGGPQSAAPHSDARSGREPAWDEFLGLCRDYRPERPFDALVVSVPAALLASAQPEAQLALTQLAKRAHRRLWLAQNRFAMRFGVYVVVSGCEHIEGFGALARALPESVRGGMLGWSSPHELGSPYRSEWVDEALDQTVRALGDACAERFALAVDVQPPGAGEYFLLPARVAGLRPQLELYLDELMRPSSYHEPFLLRGVYFSGDAAVAASAPLLPMSSAVVGSADGPLDPDAEPTWPAAPVGPVGVVPTPTPPLPAELREPAFLRDLFEQKVFAEIGLTRPSGSQRLTRPLLHRGLRWGAWGLAGVWGIGLIGGSLVLQAQSQHLQQVLQRLQLDSDARLRAAQRGQPLPAGQQRERTLALLQLMEQMDHRRLWSLFMPGSWPLFDDLPQHLRERLERAFGEVAVATLRQGLYERVAQLAGVPQDPASGEPIAGTQCQPPLAGAADSADAAPAGVATLGFEDLPGFARWLDYLAAVEQLDLATGALQRLLDPALPPSGQDLALLVRGVLGTELPGSATHAAGLFRTPAARQGGLALGPLQAALHCGLRGVQARLQQRAFEENDLLQALRALDSRVTSLAAGDQGDSPDDSTQAWRDLLTELRELDQLLARGGGAWMQQRSLQPGPAWERGLARIAASPLLGPERARQAQAEAEAAFQRFDGALSEAIQTGGALGVFWQEKEARWAASAELGALREGLQGLFAQPWMQGPADPTLTDAGSEALIGWDGARLDQALAVAELRKRFQSEGLSRFPQALRDPVQQLVQQQLAAQVAHHLSAALLPGGSGSDPAAGDAERGRLARIQLLLRELGARRLAEQLRTLLQRNALARLRALDDALERAELYAPAGRSFAAWQGERGPVLAAFGLPDAGALGVYLGQQRQRSEALAHDAEALLGAAGGLGGGMATGLGERWSAIARDLERYRLRNPNSSLLALENFLTAMAGDVDAGNCQDRLARTSGSGPRGADYFAQRHQQLAQTLQRRCGELRSRDQQELWSQFATQFNRVAAGRPPFASPGWSAETPPLETDELAALFASHERAQRALRDLGGQGGDARQPGSGAVRRFLDQFERSRAFLLPLVPGEDGSAGGWDLAVEFRAHPQGELEGNKVIDWSIDVGSQHLGWRDPPRPLRWEPGQPVTLNWRFAKDGPAQPRPDERQPALRVEQRSVSMRYADHWALLNLLLRHRDGEGSGRADGRSQLLRVEIPLTLQPDAPGAAPTEGRARLYLRLTLSPPGKRTPLVWPGAFVTRAPELPRP
jgi:type VI secretion system protein ImpL